MTTLANALAAYPWRDKEGIIRPAVGSPSTEPDYLEFITGSKIWAYGLDTGDLLDLVFHMPHDWVVGSDLYVHPHWGHNGTGISGDLQFTLHSTYADRNLAPPVGVFSAAQTDTIDLTTLTIGDYPQHCHSVDELLIATSGGVGTLYDADLLDTDGIILITLELTTKPTVSTGDNRIFVFTSDLHYQSTNIGTVNKDPDYRV